MKESPSCGEPVARKTLDVEPSADHNQLVSALMNAHFSPEQHRLRELDRSMREQTNDIQNNIVK